MPELPDVTVYVEALTRRIRGERLEEVRLAGPFLLRTVSPPIADAAGRAVVGVHRLGKRIVIDLERDLHLAIHLMIAGRFRWLARGAKVPRKLGLAAFDFTSGTLLLTEAGSKRRAALHLVQGGEALAALDRGGFELLEIDLEGFTRRARAGEPHAEASPHRSASVLRHRQRLLGRDPAPGTAVAGGVDLAAGRRRDRTAVSAPGARSLEEWTERLRSEAATGSRRR